jgi:hypothetical protein
MAASQTPILQHPDIPRTIRGHVHIALGQGPRSRGLRFICNVSLQTISGVNPALLVLGRIAQSAEAWNLGVRPEHPDTVCSTAFSANV